MGGLDPPGSPNLKKPLLPMFLSHTQSSTQFTPTKKGANYIWGSTTHFSKAPTKAADIPKKAKKKTRRKKTGCNLLHSGEKQVSSPILALILIQCKTTIEEGVNKFFWKKNKITRFIIIYEHNFTTETDF